MTTIAWRAGVIAADRQSGHGGTFEQCTKLFRVNGYAIGVAGSIAYGIAFRDWFAGNRQGDCPLTPDSDTYALVMDMRTGECEQWEAPGVGIPVEMDYTAIGSGADFAKTAMYMGASARGAVRIASKLDPHTGMGLMSFKANPVR